MFIVELKIRSLLSQKNVTLTELADILEYDVSFLHNVIKGKRAMPDAMADKLKSLFQLSGEEISGWIIADKYSLYTLKSALAEKENMLESDKVFTKKISQILQEKNISRTDLSRKIKYSQSALNQIQDLRN